MITVNIGGVDYKLEGQAVRSDDLRFQVSLAGPGGKKYYVRQSKLIGATCTCEDYMYRHLGTRGLCKHLKALAQAKIIFPAEFQESVPTVSPSTLRVNDSQTLFKFEGNTFLN
jgi:hypothetical protein